MRKAEKKPDLPASLKTGKYPLQNPFKNATDASKKPGCTFAIRIKNAFLMRFRGIYGGVGYSLLKRACLAASWRASSCSRFIPGL
ncbi:hypothetical protein DMY14_02490 [Shigella sonnei]|nr:hypothetical protein [Shigella sonnei]